MATNPGLESKTIFEELQRKNPGKYKDGQIRTLQRRIKTWKAIEDPAKEVFFAQIHKPGELGEFDFTHMDKLGITIQREPFNHMIGHFVLTYSNWESGSICFSESFESLSGCLQGALWELGGVPLTIKTDRLSAAVHKDCNPEEFTVRYTQLLYHYKASGDKINAGRANENGDVEQGHYRLKKAVSQSLMLRGSKDFNSMDEYKTFLKELFEQLNAGRKARLKEEYEVLRPLPCGKIDGSSVLSLKVGRSSTINVKHNVYSVNSRLIGEQIKVRVHANHIEIWYAQKKVDSFSRLRGEGKACIDYRHIIEWLVRKPGAFENYRYREGLYPNSHFRMAYDNLKSHAPKRANKEYIKILHIAFQEGEVKVDTAIQELITTGRNITPIAVDVLVKNMDTSTKSPEVKVSDPDLEEYDKLLCAPAEEAVSNA